MKYVLISVFALSLFIQKPAYSLDDIEYGFSVGYYRQVFDEWYTPVFIDLVEDNDHNIFMRGFEKNNEFDVFTAHSSSGFSIGLNLYQHLFDWDPIKSGLKLRLLFSSTKKTSISKLDVGFHEIIDDPDSPTGFSIIEIESGSNAEFKVYFSSLQLFYRLSWKSFGISPGLSLNYFASGKHSSQMSFSHEMDKSKIDSMLQGMGYHLEDDLKTIDFGTGNLKEVGNFQIVPKLAIDAEFKIFDLTFTPTVQVNIPLFGNEHYNLWYNAEIILLLDVKF